MSAFHPPLVLSRPRIVTNRMQFVFFSSHSLREKKTVTFKAQPYRVLYNRMKQSVVLLKVLSCLVFFFLSFFFALLFCMHFHVIDSPLQLRRVSSARPHLSLYSVTYSIQGESSQHLSEILQTGLSLLICACRAGNPTEL